MIPSWTVEYVFPVILPLLGHHIVSPGIDYKDITASPDSNPGDTIEQHAIICMVIIKGQLHHVFHIEGNGPEPLNDKLSGMSARAPGRHSPEYPSPW